MATNIQLPKDKDLAAAVIANQAGERGVIGKLFGTKEHAPTNIAALALVLLIVLLGAVLFMPMAQEAQRSSITTALISAITFTLGLIFGRSSASSD